VGGFFAARAQHYYCYVAIFKRLLVNSIYAKIHSLVSPKEIKIEISPTANNLNQIIDIRNMFSNLIGNSFLIRTNIAYYFVKNIFSIFLILFSYDAIIILGDISIFLIN
jgi:hypothetical protein